MDMFNWIMESFKEGSLTKAELEKVMEDDRCAMDLWKDWSRDSYDFIDYVRSEVCRALYYLNKKSKETK